DGRERGSARGRYAGAARLYAGRVEAHRRDVRVLRVRGGVLDRVRAGRLDPQSLRGSVHAALGARLQLPVQLVRCRAGDLRHSPGSGVRMAVGALGAAGAVEPGEVRPWA